MEEQADIGAVGDTELHRLTLSDADRDVRDWFVDQMETEGLAVRIDEMGNMFGRRSGTDSNADPILVGSHLDSQPNGGIYDGPLGTIAALELIRTLNEQEIETEHPIEIVNWTNEEGSRFQPAMMGSGVWAGAQPVAEAYETTDVDGNRFEDELERIGYQGEEPAEPTEEYEAYLELHIEQGPILDRENRSVGIVTGIVGFTWGSVTFDGEANHTGTTPMNYRSDALVAAADVVTAVRRLPSTLGERTVGTTGVGIDIWISPGAPGPAPQGIDSTGDPVMNLPWTHAGMPAIAIPAGNVDGLPIGLQCVGPFGADEQLLAWARTIEDVFSDTS